MFWFAVLIGSAPKAIMNSPINSIKYVKILFEISRILTIVLKEIFFLKTGNGGNAGRQTINVRMVQGKVELKTCRGTGGQAATNGVGGEGRLSCSWF